MPTRKSSVCFFSLTATSLFELMRSDVPANENASVVLRSSVHQRRSSDAAFDR
jgi:hypothetical protein